MSTGGYVVVLFCFADGSCAARAPDLNARTCGLTVEEAREEILAEIEFRCAVRRAAKARPPEPRCGVWVERIRAARPEESEAEHLVVVEHFDGEDGFVARLKGTEILAEAATLDEAVRMARETLGRRRAEPTSPNTRDGSERLVDARVERYMPTGVGMPAVPRARIDLRRLLETGECGPFRIGMTMDELYEVAGPPDSACVNEIRPSSRRSHPIWRYGGFPYVEFYCRLLSGDFRVESIVIDLLWCDGKVAERKIEIEPWIAIAGITPQEFWDKAAREGVTPHDAYSNPESAGHAQTFLIYSRDPGVAVHFQINLPDPEDPERKTIEEQICKLWFPALQPRAGLAGLE